MNFRVIDGDDDYLELVDDFIQLYNHSSINVNEICEVLGVPYNIYCKLRKYCVEEGLIILRRGKKPNGGGYRLNPSYIGRCLTDSGEYWQIRKFIDGSVEYFGNYKRYSDAELVVNRLIMCDWDKSQLDKIREEVLD